MKASEFKAKCLELMDRVAESGEAIVITKNGKPVAQLGPVKEHVNTLFGAHRGEIQINGDIIEPLEVDWEALR